MACAAAYSREEVVEKACQRHCCRGLLSGNDGRIIKAMLFVLRDRDYVADFTVRTGLLRNLIFLF